VLDTGVGAADNSLAAFINSECPSPSARGGHLRLLTVVLLAVCTASAGTITVTIDTRPGDVNLIQRDGYQVVSIASDRAGLGILYTTQPGNPLLPVYSGNVLIPAGSELTSMKIVKVERTELGEGITLYPVQPPRPVGADVPFVKPSPAAYLSTAKYPASPLTQIPAGSKTGFRIAGFTLCPFEYRAASGSLTLLSHVELAVSYRQNSVAAPTLTQNQLQLAERGVEAIVVNPEDAVAMAPRVAAKLGNEIDVIIVTSTAMQPAFETLRSYYMRKGFFTVIMPTESIYARYTGYDNAEKVRNMLKEKFAQNGLKYVVLGGDVGICPLRYAYLEYSPYNVPADWYFADLDGTWDDDGDHQYGEMTGDNPDLFGDIIVSRIGVDDATQFAHFFAKDTTYELAPDTAYLNNVLLPFEDLWSSIDYYGRIVNKNIALALSAMSTWEVDSMLYMPPSTVVAGINAGRHLWHFAGHGATTLFGSTFSTSNISQLTNAAKPFIVNSMACDCGDFDNGEGLGELLLTDVNGAVSTATNARFGWGAPPEMGPSEALCMEFYNNYVKGFNQGEAYNLAKDFWRNASFSQLTYRWSIYDWTFQGDPTMRMWRCAPREVAVDFPDTISASPQTLTAEVSYVAGEQAAGARVALNHAGELVARAVTNSSGVASLAIPAVQDTWTLSLTAIAQDGRWFTKPVAVSAGAQNALVVYSRNEIDDPNGRLDPGEESDVYLVVENRGDTAASAVSGTLYSDSPYLTIVNGTSSYGDIAVGDTARGNAYRVYVSRDCPHGHRAELRLFATSSKGFWLSNLTLVVGLEHARSGVTAVHDTADFVLSVTANGGIGTTQWRGEGLGFIYPKSRQWSASALMHGSFMLGTDTTWVADNFYGVPWQATPQNFALVESLRTVYPPQLGDQEYVCKFDDNHSSSPKNLLVRQRSYVSAEPAYKDFAVLDYCIYNEGDSAASNLYAAVACDFRTMAWNLNDGSDYAGTDSARILAYVKSASSGETLALGVRPIYPSATGGWANCINQATYISDGFTKSEKFRFMDGTLRSTTGTSPADWEAMSSIGPFTIAAGDSQIVAFVICGGPTVAQMTTNSDTAAEWYFPPVAVAESREPLAVSGFHLSPSVSSGLLNIRYSLAQLAPVIVTLYDASGRTVDATTVSPAGTSGELHWRPRGIERGIYFLKVGDQTQKAVMVR
jgi:hypothetical protein